ncbi:MAG: adenylate kinase [Opitutaceae bacterium]|nr:adenylate kinase [Opitutaceae bacterium]
MAEAESTFWPLSLGASPAKAKLLILGSAPAALADRSRSLNLEHVSSAQMMEQEISRQTPAGVQTQRAIGQGLPVPDQILLGVMRRWFWTRKLDAGFVLTDFPATLLQAQVFDEWLETRGSGLTGVWVIDEVSTSPALINHYRTLGLDVVLAEQPFAA